MSSIVQKQLRDYITSPFGLLQIKDVHVGNVRASEINITGREAAIHALELSTPRNSMPAKTRGLRLMLLTELGG
ncbi:hypothetical protein WA698_13255, partial [Xanthomonas arboricola pv. pruni]|nr:hypothetical protein [Xanthomonas arboricola pv. pruni]MDN0287987.1 hypothetical protein [Xanthomonas arboricola pv. pruni]MDN0291705.1 hypothetical protein [Xanthomonas arboricola pv. pruni]MDN0296106.1 hypothetical protein [Xanthomonas arboricola pv. pruni]MDN0300179.1 hypothetical protein [Xanthomonas arboricola pv. pruni]